MHARPQHGLAEMPRDRGRWHATDDHAVYYTRLTSLEVQVVV